MDPKCSMKVSGGIVLENLMQTNWWHIKEGIMFKARQSDKAGHWQLIKVEQKRYVDLDRGQVNAVASRACGAAGEPAVTSSQRPALTLWLDGDGAYAASGLAPINHCCARGRPIIVEWERDARHSAGLSLVRAGAPAEPRAPSGDDASIRDVWKLETFTVLNYRQDALPRPLPARKSGRTRDDGTGLAADSPSVGVRGSREERQCHTVIANFSFDRPEICEVSFTSGGGRESAAGTCREGGRRGAHWAGGRGPAAARLK
ncbi:hypothetical protein EVAR_33423_1 [Eumeta japonica]|uniref:Uncharacterized protein n=1 Tax=Eumeta variegata TaxID=151549 RepID=A0A4C1W4G2_EUMVA|nr:hypothetical protein EVAR_33423_1 [Eumeta japonica]